MVQPRSWQNFQIPYNFQVWNKCNCRCRKVIEKVPLKRKLRLKLINLCLRSASNGIIFYVNILIICNVLAVVVCDDVLVFWYCIRPSGSRSVIRFINLLQQYFYHLKENCRTLKTENVADIFDSNDALKLGSRHSRLLYYLCIIARRISYIIIIAVVAWDAINQ